MRVAVFNSKSYDEEFLNWANRDHSHELVYFKPHLSLGTCGLGFGFEGICAFVNDKLQTATWLVKSLQQRAQTILKVAAEIVRRQDAFFRLGVAHLRPLILRDVAEATELHESTVSRVTSSKYIATPRGTYELKYFFTTAIGATEGGESHSAESIRHRINAMIDAETADDILSDDAIVAALRREGVDIARRTVAKYRDALRIPSSVQRKREKAVPV